MIPHWISKCFPVVTAFRVGSQVQKADDVGGCSYNVNKLTRQESRTKVATVFRRATPDAQERIPTN
jgi:hypothetical protein